MATTKLKLRSDRKNNYESTTVYVQVCIDSKVKLYTTGIKVKPEHWDEKSQRLKKSWGYGYEKEFAKINMRRLIINNIIDSAMLSSQSITFQMIEEQLNKTQQTDETLNQPTKNLYDWYEEYIKERGTFQSVEIAKHRRTSLNKLKAFFGKKIPSFEDINYKFYSEFRNWLLEDVELANSSVNKQFDYLKGFLRYASKLKLYNAIILEDFERLKEYETHIVYITREELRIIWMHEFKSDKLERVRDLFVFACSTGLRESDFSNVKPENIKDGSIHLTTIKTADPLVIPLNTYSRAVLEKYNNNLPKYSQQKFNDYIKEVAKEIGIDTPEQVITYKKGIRFETTVPKYELITSHTGRRTFITQSILRGLPIPVIRSMTGHKDLKSFQKYIKITDKDKRSEMDKWDN
ncbi:MULTISPECIES: site-specific integrase [unclassified Arcicella]|uniref:site-specific integrase n=1 Tax=unclassified Arcicella TaxID=2644986 RepID=UPI00285F4209|nr:MULTISPECIES: site-specific integrase [unclassified Arcicella]MDR6561286.1 integrase [Arcicella sp. BE51]MDR6811170.1 integrase [Arcicella sp. BE140]MDR6822520.1 integrase [Arcicella sp. BE139]